MSTSAFPRYEGRILHSLEGFWDFHLTDGAADPAAPDLAGIRYDDRLPVPGAFDALPRYAATATCFTISSSTASDVMPSAPAS